MKTHLNPTAAPLPNEGELLKRIDRLHKRDDRPPVAVIAIENLDGDVRLVAVAHTEAEATGVVRLLDDREFVDRLHPVSEETDEDGNTEVIHEQVSHPDYDHLFTPIAGRRMTP